MNRRDLFRTFTVAASGIIVPKLMGRLYTKGRGLRALDYNEMPRGLIDVTDHVAIIPAGQPNIGGWTVTEVDHINRTMTMKWEAPDLPDTVQLTKSVTYTARWWGFRHLGSL